MRFKSESVIAFALNARNEALIIGTGYFTETVKIFYGGFRGVFYITDTGASRQLKNYFL